MKINSIIKHTIKNYLNEVSDSYDFKKTPIMVTEDNYNEALYLRNKYKHFNKIGVGTFLSSIFLWRVVDEYEFNLILKTKKIVGGEYAVPPERYFGASFSGSRNDVIDWGIRVKNFGRYNGQLYVIGINGEDKEFLNLNMEERLEEQGLKYEVGDFVIDTKLGNVGLGFSVRNVNLRDVLFIYELDDMTKKINDVTYDYT